MIGPSDEVGSTKRFGVVGHALEGLGLGQPEIHFHGRLATYPPNDKDDAQMLSASKFEIQNMSSAVEAQVRLQLPRVEGVEAFELLIQYAFIALDGARGADWNRCHADEGFMELINRGPRHVWQRSSEIGANKLGDGAKDGYGVRQRTGE